GLLEPVLSGSVTFENSILAPLRNNYLCEESKESFTYNSALLVNNPDLQKRYSAFRAEKRKNGYSEEELEESFGFMLLDDKSRAKRLAETGLIVGHGTCTILGDCSKGVYISKYSDCLDLKRWYDGKTGYIVLLKLTKGRVKEVTENYTQNFTPPTAGYDCHVSEQLRAVCATTSSFLAFERTQYYMYELLDGWKKVEPCPRHVCPFAVVAFSYGKTSISLELKERSQEKLSFQYQPWSGQLKIESLLYDIGLKSSHGAMFPAKLPKTVQVNHAIGVSELRKTLPQAVFETSPLGEVSFDGKWFTMYDVISFETKNDLASLTEELKEKDMALVVCLEDGGFLILLHSSNFLSYEGVSTDKAFGLQGMFVYPDSKTVPRETKSGYRKTAVSSEVLQILPALNYAELEMEKCPPKQREEPLGIMEKHLQNFAALILPGLTGSPTREASMFPDQYDVPDGFPLFAPKWTEQTGDRLRTYLESPHGFQIPVARSLEILAAGKQQRSDDNDDDVYYYISSPEAPQTPAGMVLERNLNNETDHITSRDVSNDIKKTAEQQAEPQKTEAAELPHCATIKEVTPAAAVVAAPDDKPFKSTDPSPTSGDLPTEHYAQDIHAVNSAQDSEETSERVSVDEKCSGKENSETVQPTNVESPSIEMQNDSSTLASNAEMEVDRSENVDCLSVLPEVKGQIPVADQVLQEADLPTSISPPTTSVNRTEALIEGCKEVQPEASGNVIAENKSVPNRRGKRRRRKALKRNANTVSPITSTLQNTTLALSFSTEATPEQSSNSDTIHSSPSTLKKDWRSLPRRKKHWNADASVKRTLRSDFKSTELPSDQNDETENNTLVTEPTGNVVPSAPKRKMEGFNMRERYGLKNIVTDCGFVFVPHGSEVAPGDIKSNENMQTQESSKVLTSSPIAEKPTTPSTLDKPQLSETENIGQHTPEAKNISPNPAEALSSGDITPKDPVPSQRSEETSVPEPAEQKNKITKKGHVYKAISISKLKTVLKRAKRTKSPASPDHRKSVSDNPEPDPKKAKPHNDVALPKNSEVTPHVESAGSRKPVENTQSKPSLRTTSSKEKRISKIPKENGFDNLSPNAIVKQAGQQLTSKPIENRVKGKRVSSDGQTKKQEVAVGVPAPSDALNLLADLALSVNSDEILPSLGEKHPGAKTSSSPQSVIDLLKDLKPSFKLPTESPFPEGLVVTGDLILEISKEHSYSQPTSLPSGLKGICPQVQPPVGSVESCLSLKSGILLKLPDLTNCPGYTNKGGKNGWRSLTSSNTPAPDAIKNKLWSSLFFRCRSVSEKEGSIQVTRHWKENYDYKYDSKFTNDRLDKCVTRALHGKWDFSIEDTYEHVHLIFHMWIGLFYSKPTSRFFHFDQICPPVERKDPAKVLQGAVQTPTTLPDVEPASKDDKPTSLDPVLDALDLSVKAFGAEDHCTAEEHPQPISGIQSRPEHMKEKEITCIRPDVDYSSTVIAGGSLMDYRSNVETSEEISTPDHKDCSDLEEDTTEVTETPCTKPLEGNSGYSQLCDHAASMRIEEQKSANVQKSEPASAERFTSMPTSVKIAGMASTTRKNMGIFHQIIGHVRPVIISKVHESLSGRKIILKSLSFKEKYKDRARVSVHGESVFNDELRVAAANEGKRDRASARDDSGNKNECAPKAKTGTCPAVPVAVSDGNDSRIEVKSLFFTRDETQKVIRDGNSSTIEKSVSGERNNEAASKDLGNTPVDQCVIDDSRSDIGNDKVHVETSVNNEATIKVGPVPDFRDEMCTEIPDRSHKTKEAVKPVTEPKEVLINGETQAKVAPVHVGDDAALNLPDAVNSNDTVEPVRDTTGSESDTHLRVHVNDETSKVPVESDMSVNDGENTCDVCKEDEASKSVVSIRDPSVDVLDEPRDKLGIIDDIIAVRDVNNTDMEAESELDVSANKQDVKNTNKPGLDVKNETPANLQDVNVSTKDETQCQLDVGDCSSVDRQHDSDTTEDMAIHEEMYAMEECVSENDESNTNDSGGKTAAEINRDTDIKSCSEEQNTIDESQDWTDCIDMDISDDDSEHESQEQVHEMTVSGGQILPNVLEEDSVKLQEGEIKTEAHVAGGYKEPEISDCSFAGYASATSDQLITLQEDNSSSAVSDLCIPKQNESERTIVVKHETPEVNQYQPRKVTDQKPNVPAICEKSAAKRLEIQDDFDASPSALQIDTEIEVNSRCGTPTLDERTYSSGTDAGSGNQEVSVEDTSEREDYGLQKIPSSSWLALDSSDNSQSGLEKSPAHREKCLTEDPIWPRDTSAATVKETSESKPFTTDDRAPEENLFEYDFDAIPTSRNFKEVELQQDQFDHFSGPYEDDAYEELPSPWTRSSSFKTKEQTDFSEWYAPDENRRYTNSVSVRREVAYRPRAITESTSDFPGWVQRTHYSQSTLKTEKSDERAYSFRHRAGLYESNDESESHGTESKGCSKKKRKRKSCQNDWDEEDFNATVDYSLRKTFSCSSDQTSVSRTQTSSPKQHKGESKQSFDWRRYFRREGIFDSNEADSGPFHDAPSSIVTMLDKKGNRVIFESPSTQRRSSGTHSANQSVKEQQSNSNTQSLMEHELLIFSEKMTHLLKNSKSTSRANKDRRRATISPNENPMTIQFSRLDEQNSFSSHNHIWPTLSTFKINVDMSERTAAKKPANYSKPLHLQSLFCERGTQATCSKLSDISKECSKSYHTMMNDVCVGKTVPHQNDELKRKWDAERAATGKQSGFCGRIKKDMFNHLHDNLNSVVRQACKTKYKFYILVTSADPFFEETKDLLEAEGHTAVEPYQFDFDGNGQTPLLIILRNEDIAEHIFEVPHLLELKKSSRVLFAGIDQPDDVVNLTHQELFAKGGFVVFDETALDTLNLENMKKVVGIMEELDKKGKWKWFLHYRDSRKLRENARCRPEAQRRKQFIDCCQEAGIVEVLPYHECDIISRDRPDYLRCLVRLQIQNVSARFPVFITDTPDDTFEKNGILTMNIYTFSRIISNDTCSVS
ncbi:protein FAM208B isoform X2, partial [Silurus asotus]